MFLDSLSEKSFMQMIEPYFFAFHHFFIYLGFNVSPTLGCKKKKSKLNNWVGRTECESWHV
jgi:hypothetical protein